MFKWISFLIAMHSVLPGILACSCGEPRPCGNALRSSVIFTGLTIAGGEGEAKTARFKIEEAYKGVAKGAVVEIYRDAETSCAVNFKIGQSYLVYADQTNGRIMTTACRGSRRMQDAAADLNYLESWRQGRTPTELVGSVWPDARGGELDWQRYYRMIASAHVQLIGPDGATRNIPVNKRGDFVALVSPPGHYKTSAILENWISTRMETNILVPEHGCGEAGFPMRPDGQVSGRALEADGKSAQRVLLKLSPVEGFGDELETETDETGHFRFRGVLAASYHLGVSPGQMDDPSPKVPYAPTYYPGVREETRATAIHIRDFEKTQVGSFKLSPRLSPRTIRVTVTLEDGQSVHGASVSCTPEGRSYWKKEPTDSRGRIVFPAMDGLAYVVDVDIPSFHQLAKSGYERARWVLVPTGSGVTDVRVVMKR